MTPQTDRRDRQLHLNLFVYGHGHHEGGWRHPRSGRGGAPGEARTPLTDLSYYRDLARTAERGLFDSLFLADVLVFNPAATAREINGLEPVTTLAALAGVTEKIGLIATASTTYSEPFNLARQFATIDHLSGGRAGWNIVTSWAPGVDRNFNGHSVPHDERYERAEEFVDVVTALWDSWDADAVVNDPGTGVWADETKIRPVDAQGTWFQVAGPLNVPRPPQGHPVLVQAGSSAAGTAFGATYAEAVFTAQPTLPAARAFYRDIKDQAASRGRSASDLLVLPGLSPVIGSTDEESRRIERELTEYTDPTVGLAHLSARFGGADLSHLSLDERITDDDLPRPAPGTEKQGELSRAEVIRDIVRREPLTLRELLGRLAFGRGHLVVVGGPERIADVIEDWFLHGGADGFNIMPPVLPGLLDDFVDEVVPLLQRRGLFRTGYEADTLRGHYGLDVPDADGNRHSSEPLSPLQPARRR